ncbi:hypothetical protein LCGC14_3124750 [marine sediment metagenome]|uniref:Uncharacterized protein n=1 Tax=marine sediment metagenome TaxID=412755 RepID=A0A0F8W1H8_9ZZZZ
MAAAGSAAGTESTSAPVSAKDAAIPRAGATAAQGWSDEVSYLPSTLRFYPGQAVRQGIPNIEGAAPRKGVAETPTVESIRLAPIGVDAMKVHDD